MSLSARRAWIEIICPLRGTGPAMSLSVRRAWIEICPVDYKRTCILVALRKESVDRNSETMLPSWTRYVALRKESVDRNPNAVVHVGMIAWSLSARRAWIEI